MVPLPAGRRLASLQEGGQMAIEFQGLPQQLPGPRPIAMDAEGVESLPVGPHMARKPDAIKKMNGRKLMSNKESRTSVRNKTMAMSIAWMACATTSVTMTTS